MAIPLEVEDVKPRFLVVSIGKPNPWVQAARTTACHGVMSCIRELARDSHDQPEIKRELIGGKPTWASHGRPYIFLQCPTGGRDAGNWLKMAYDEMLEKNQLCRGDLRLAVIHDDPEGVFGALNFIPWGRSDRRDTAVRWIERKLERTDRDAPWLRISIGVKTGRESGIFSGRALRVLDGDVPKQIMEVLEFRGTEWLKALRSGPS
ncbi:hypothetical protein GE09DRAFT_1119785 [Coniochaeta sp. 2T2.1]|nr:hypothetical protein GE09DRAFT_1119785 [Coniochaeta sp. 2T2.1]